MAGPPACGPAEAVLGRLLVAATADGVASLHLRDSPAARARAAEAAGRPVVEAPERLARALSELRDYCAGDLKEFGVAIDWRLTSDVQRRVLTTLYESVPYGQVVTYGELGDRSGTGLHAQVVGQVMGSNPVPLIVPCHRVVASNGLGGYSGGSGGGGQRRLALRERALPATLDR